MAAATSTVCSSRSATAAAHDSACLPAGFSCAEESGRGSQHQAENPLWFICCVHMRGVRVLLAPRSIAAIK